ncbi:MAG: acetolactate synthase small subunit [Planctomycetota bacterium]
MRHVLSALVSNQPGVLAHISGMLASRAYNIDSLTVGETENAELSRMTFVVRGDVRTLDQVRKQLEKIVTVVRVIDFSDCEFVERDLMLMKVQTGVTAADGGSRRSEIKELTDVFRGRIVDVSHTHVMIEMSGQEDKLQAFMKLMEPFGIIEMVRTGRVALQRQGSITEGLDPEDVGADDAASGRATADPAAAEDA